MNQMMHSVKNSLLSFLIGLFSGIVLTLIIGFLYFLITDFGKGMGPQVLSDQKIRTKLEEYFKVPLPAAAGQLYYREEGFLDGCCHIGVSLAPQDAWHLIRTYIQKEKTDFKALDVLTSFSWEPEKTPLWSLASLKEPLYFEIREKETLRVIIYDEISQRLLVYFSSW
ncbi:MAG: hypothetical protein V2I97_04050 [Desulfococcaceae bacterium]|jgi:hypothetical protein|nr:hypothetical protein [Desulfococcaceae bacterium]